MTTSLFTYLQSLRTRLSDQKMEVFDEGDLISFVNSARKEIARQSQCLRALTPISGSVVQITVTNPGSGYTNPTVTITPPDFPSCLPPSPLGRQAIATAETWQGGLSTVNVTDGGSGYFEPQATISDPTGTGAEVEISLSPFNILNEGQEVYRFEDVDLSMFPGYGEIFMVKSVALIYANYRYALPCYSFSEYQAKIRQYPWQYSYVPTVMAQYGQGASGSLYFYPLPSQVYQMEWDCFCTPQDLETDQDVEALPDPWTECVVYFAAYLAYMSVQNMNAARTQLELYDRFVNRAGYQSRPGRAVNPYGRYLVPFAAGLSTMLALFHGVIS